MENIVRKGVIACNKYFLLFPQCSLPHMAFILHFKFILKCCLQFVSIWASLKFCHLVNGLYLFHVLTFQAVKAESDCTRVLEVEADNVKALFRRAQARKVDCLTPQ